MPTEPVPKRVADVLIIHNANAIIEQTPLDVMLAAAGLAGDVGTGSVDYAGAGPLDLSYPGADTVSAAKAGLSPNPPRRAGGIGVLLVRPVWQAKNPKGWQMPGGHAEPGETPDQTAQREADEEIGQGAVRVGRRLVEITEDDGTVASVFEGHLNFMTEIRVDGVEIGEWGWFAVSEAAKVMNPLSANLFRAALEKMGVAA